MCSRASSYYRTHVSASHEPAATGARRYRSRTKIADWGDLPVTALALASALSLRPVSFTMSTARIATHRFQTMTNNAPFSTTEGNEEAPERRLRTCQLLEGSLRVDALLGGCHKHKSRKLNASGKIYFVRLHFASCLGDCCDVSLCIYTEFTRSHMQLCDLATVYLDCDNARTPHVLQVRKAIRACLYVCTYV